MMYTAALLAIVPLVAAHGYVQNATIGGKVYDFYQPYQDPYMNPAPARISRAIQGNGPVENLALADLECGGYTAGGISGSKPAALHAPVTAGSSVNLRWTLWPDSHQGPLITYMARCPDTGCQDYQTKGAAVWFKIAEAGRVSKDVWAATPLMKNGNAGYTYTVPQCLAPGSYLVRHELIALHSAYSYPGAQFYPGCHQLKVSGSGTKVVKDGLVSFPGAYKATDPGVTYDMYQGALNYVIPGPKVMTC